MPIEPTEPHDWWPLDVERGLEVRQRTRPDEPNVWEVRNATGTTVALNDFDYDRLRTGDWVPEVLR